MTTSDCTTRKSDESVANESLRWLAEFSSSEQVRLDASRALLETVYHREMQALRSGAFAPDPFTRAQ